MWKSQPRPEGPARSHPALLSSQARSDTTAATGVAKSSLMYNVASMHRVQPSFRILTGCCVILLALLSLLPAQNMVRTAMPGGLEHFVAYAGSASIAVAGYGRRGAVRIIGLFLGIRRPSGVSPALFAGPTPVNRGFFGIGARSDLRGARRGPVRALPMEACISGRRLI